MELKDSANTATNNGSARFQSHLYGIERNKKDQNDQYGREFQSHLYGIERSKDLSRLFPQQIVSIAPLWN